MHDLLMSNYFAQTKVLAFGKTADEIAAEGVDPHVVAHKVMPGNRPSTSILAPELAVGRGPAHRPVRASGVRRGHDLGHQPVRPVGCRRLGKTQAKELLGVITDTAAPPAQGRPPTGWSLVPPPPRPRAEPAAPFLGLGQPR